MRILALLLLATPLRAEEIGPERLHSLPAADVVILGEVHDNPVHHQHQAIAVAALNPSALVFEMLTPKQARAYDGTWDSLGWTWPHPEMYRPIFEASDAPIFGGDPGREVIRRAMTEGAVAVFGADAARFGLADAPEDQAALEAEQQAAHCNALPEAALPGMVEAQRLRDAELARAVIAAHAETGGPVVLIAGSGHARLDAVPAVLAKAAPDLRVLSIGQVEGTGAQPFDLWLTAPAPDREDPCAAFGG
ncbi:ChaN family lipoprotein [Cereibacter sp. SYSU M97828]|nr:ChaN family lipoprotein [Cereibacter flavus]